jgi:ferredoxin-type protein NapH
MRGVDAKRQARLKKSKEKRAAQNASLPTAACPTCPVTRLVSNRYGGAAANSVLLASLVGSAVLQFPVFCAICPIGITTRGMFHLKAWTFLTKTLMPIILELSIIPIIAVLLSLREKRYWCRKICPVGVTLNFVGSASPFLKPTVNHERCISYGCPSDCKDSKLGYCAVCRAADQKNCETVCPQGINLVQGESLARCTKCMECYIHCDRGAVQVQVVGRSELYDALKDWFKRVHKKVVG